MYRDINTKMDEKVHTHWVVQVGTQTDLETAEEKRLETQG